MASHGEINPSDIDLLLGTGLNALEVATGLLTRRSGGVWIDTGDGGGILAGEGASDGVNRVDKDGVQLPLVDTSGIDKAAQDARKAAADAASKADEAIAKGEQIRQDAQAGIDDARRQAQAAAVKADKVRTDLTQQVQNVKSEMDLAVESAQTSANKAQSAAEAAQKAADKANASTVDLDKSIQAVDAKAVAAKQAAAEAQSKAENVASDLDSANAVIEQHTTELGTLTTKVSNAVTKSDSALSVSTEAKQTATEASTTASSAYKDSQTALTQSTTATQTATAAKTTAESASKTANDSLKQSSAAVQTANQISTTLKTEYQTKADADRIYATQSSLKQTSDSITASVSKTYATKDALTALQNAADNAIESWRGTGVPTLENKPASDWTTDTERKRHSGDLYYDKATGKAYRFGSDDGETYTWELNQDTDVTKALADASKAQTSANNAQASATAANTAAGKAQSTANTAVGNAATAKNAADAAQSSANKAQGDVDKLKIDIPETYATKSSLTQTAESITANVESVKTTANSAVTAASKAQQTAEGISANLSKNYQTKSQADTIYATKANLKATSESISTEVTKAQGTADGAVTAASKAQQTADAVTLNLSKNYQTKAQNDALYATQTSLKATSDSLSAKITANAKTAQSAVDKATSLEANLNGFKTTVSQAYTTKTDFDNLTVGGTNLLVRSNFIKTWLDTVNGTLIHPDASVSGSEYNGYSSSKKPITVDPNTTYVLSAYDSMTDTVANTGRISQFDSEGTFINFVVPGIDLRDKGHITFTTDENAASILVGIYSFPRYRWKLEKGTKPTDWSPAPEDLQPAGDYATNSSLTQTANSIKAQVTEVSKTANSAMSKVTTVEQTANGLSSKITEQAKTLNATVRTANEAKSTADSNKTTISQVSTTASDALSKASTVEQDLNGFKTTVANTYQPKSGMGSYATTSQLTQTANQIRGEVSEKYQSKDGMSSYATTSALTQKADEITGKVTEVAKTAQGNTTTISQVSQKVDRINTTLSQQIGGKADTSRVSSLEQNLDGFKSTVAKTYQTKGDYPSKAEVQSRIDQSASSIKSTVGQTYTTLDATEALRKSATRTFTLGGASGKAKWVKLGYLTSNGDSSSVLLHVYSGDGFNGAARQNAEFEIFVKDGWQEHPSASGAFGVSVQRIRNADDVKVKVMAFDSTACDIWAYLPWAWWSGHYTLQGDYQSWIPYPNVVPATSDAEPTNGVAQDLAYDTLSTRSYVDQTSKSVALGVMQNYRGADGSGLATKSDITATANSITSTVSSTYATKSGVTQEISSTITQNNERLDVRFATKAENQMVRDTANTANSNASNAQSRVGVLEDCISLTSDGVRVGKRSNGVFTGPSALVGTDGAFHVLARGASGHDEDVAKLGHDLLVIKSKLNLSDGSHLDRLTAGAYGDSHFAIRMNPAGAVFDNHESVQIWQTGWQTITTGNGCEGYASYGYRGGCLRFRGRVRTTINGDNSLFADPDLLDLPTTPVNRNYLLPAYRNGTLEWTNTYVPANTRQVKIYGVWDWVSLDPLSIAQ